MLATGKGAHYPILTVVVADIVANYPDKAKDVGLFALPGDDAREERPDRVGAGRRLHPDVHRRAPSSTRPRSSSPSSPARTAATSQAKAGAPTGPYAVKGCTLPADVPQAIKDMQPYFDKEGASSLALEFLSPVKGPALEQITRRGRLRHPQGARTAPRSTTRTSRSRPSSSGSRAGEAVSRRPPARPRARRDVEARRRTRDTAAAAEAPYSAVPVLVLPAGRGHLRRAVPRADVRVVLLQPDPVDAVRLAVHRLRQLRRRSSRSRRWSRASPTR